MQLENVEHCGGEPEQAANMNRLTWMLKSWAESVVFTSAIYVHLKLFIICTVGDQPARNGRSIAAVTNNKKGAMRASTWAVSATVGDVACKQ